MDNIFHLSTFSLNKCFNGNNERQFTPEKLFALIKGALELASAGISVSIFNIISKVFNIPLLSVATSFVAEDISKYADEALVVVVVKIKLIWKKNGLYY